MWRALLEWPRNPWPPALDMKPANKAPSDIRRINVFVLPFLGLCFLAVLAHFGFTRAAGVALMWAIASLCAGGAVGFLFGIPRAGEARNAAPATTQDAAATDGTATQGDTSRPAKTGLRPNTNLEEVSDWLTKIIVGLGLVNLKDIDHQVWRIAANVAAGWPSLPTAQGVSIATALIAAFAVSGFLSAYVYTRLFLQAAIGRADAGLRVDDVQRELESLPQAPAAPGKPAVLSASEWQVARRLESASTAGDLPVLVGKMRELAHEYEQLRETHPSGPQRTQLMADVVRKMRGLALATLPAFDEFAASPSAGERLAAVAMLQTRFNPQYIGWLADRLVEERPFVAFNAASALLTASRNLSGETLRRLFDLVRAAKLKLEQLGLAEADRDGLVDQILSNDPLQKKPTV